MLHQQKLPPPSFQQRSNPSVDQAIRNSKTRAAPAGHVI
jgi:hypothetical protein